jgi:hypothetical protein
MEASMNVWQKETTACQEVSETCLEKAKANPEKMKAMAGVFKERLDKMNTTDLEANQEKSNAVAEHQEVPKEEAAVETIRALED